MLGSIQRRDPSMYVRIVAGIGSYQTSTERVQNEYRTNTERIQNEYKTNTKRVPNECNQHASHRFHVRGGVGAGAVHLPFPHTFAKHEHFAGLVAEIGQGDSFLQRPLALKTLFEGLVGGQSFPFTDVAVFRCRKEVNREKRETSKHA